MTTYNYLTHRRRPVTLDTYESLHRWRERAFTAKDSVSTDGAELSFAHSCPLLIGHRWANCHPRMKSS